jgi:hypothetical protein
MHFPEAPFLIRLRHDVLETVTLLPQGEVTKLSSLHGNYAIDFFGQLLNPDVIQLNTPASIRSEHPIATIVSCDMTLRPDFNMLEKMARTLSTTAGAFMFVVQSPFAERVIVGIRNLPLHLVQSRADVLGVVNCSKRNNALYMIGRSKTALDFIDVEIPARPTGKQLFVSDKYRDEWPAEFGFRKGVDTRITYTQLGYEYVNTPKSPLLAARLVLRAIEFANELEDSSMQSIVMGLEPENIDLLTATTLTRLAFIASDRRYQLDLPRYNQAINGRVARAC